MLIAQLPKRGGIIFTFQEHVDMSASVCEKPKSERLDKRLCYILRYGAQKEGLDVSQNGFVQFSDLVRLPQFNIFTSDDVMYQLRHSRNFHGGKRFEVKCSNGTVMVRSLYSRHIHRNPCHTGSKVARLLEQCMDVICDNLDCYDLQNFPDEHLLNSMIRRLKLKKKLNGSALKILLNPHIECLNLWNTVLTQGMIRTIYTQCPHLKVLCLRRCGYIITDHTLQQLLKNLSLLQSLNLSCCHHVTDTSIISTICKYSRDALSHLSLFNCPNISGSAILHLVETCQLLCFLDVYDNTDMSLESRVTLSTLLESRSKPLTVFLKGFRDYEGDEMDQFNKVWQI